MRKVLNFLIDLAFATALFLILVLTIAGATALYIQFLGWFV